ncbi:hypothetical protein EV292_102103 [Sphingomonas sp. BK235]|nr:hypothetical protein EV292_102103 [Sphingomonas sp. BK235]
MHVPTDDVVANWRLFHRPKPFAAEARSYARTKTGRTYANEYHFAFTFRDGKIARLREYTDLLHVQEIFG